MIDHIAVLKKVYGVDENGEWNRNFMTPNIIETGLISDYVFEISSGIGFDHEPIYGVSICEKNTDGKWVKSDKSKMCYSVIEAYRYLWELVQEDD